MLWQCTKQDTAKNFFPLPNEIFSLGLSSGELAVYSYLLFCEDRRTYQCWPSYKSIGRAVHMEENNLIITEPTSITTKDGRKRNGSLLYTIRPIQCAVELHHERQVRLADEIKERIRVEEKLKARKKHSA